MQWCGTGGLPSLSTLPAPTSPCSHGARAQGCERSVITYSSLISACEKAGEWELALQLFEEMRAEGCTPNVISFNSLITACAQGGWLGGRVGGWVMGGWVGGRA